MSLIATGVYQNGRITLDSVPAGVDHARVRVEFEPLPTAPRRRFALTFGMLATEGARLSDWNDFVDTKSAWNSDQR